jgi:hypothetical protein
MAHDVLAHDDGVVDQQPDAQRQRHQRHVVQREPAGVDGGQRGDHRDRQGQAGDHRAAPGAQEQEHDQHREHGALADRALDVADRGLDEVGLGLQQPQLDVGRQPQADRVGRFFQRVAGGHDVGVLRLVDRHADGGVAIDAEQRLALLFAVDHLRHLVEQYRHPGAARHDDRTEFRHGARAAVDADDRLGRRADDGADRNAQVGLLQRGDHLVDRQAIGAEACRIDADLDLPGHIAAEVDAADPGGALQPAADELLGQQRQLARRAVAGRQREERDRLVVVGVDALDQRLLDVARKRWAHLRDAVAHLLDAAVQVGIEAEFDEGQVAAFARQRADQLDAGDRVDGFLDRLGDVVLDLLGRGARIVDRHRDQRRTDVRHRLDAQLPVREQAQHRQGRDHHRGEDRVIDRSARDPHRRLRRPSAPPPARRPRRPRSPARLRAGCRNGSPGPGRPG